MTFLHKIKKKIKNGFKDNTFHTNNYQAEWTVQDKTKKNEKIIFLFLIIEIMIENLLTKQNNALISCCKANKKYTTTTIKANDLKELFKN